MQNEGFAPFCDQVPFGIHFKRYCTRLKPHFALIAFEAALFAPSPLVGDPRIPETDTPLRAGGGKWPKISATSKGSCLKGFRKNYKDIGSWGQNQRVPLASAFELEVTTSRSNFRVLGQPARLKTL